MRRGRPAQREISLCLACPTEIILGDFINATVGFTKLSNATHRSAKSLMRMLGPRGKPQARNLFEIVAYLQHAEGVRFEVAQRPPPHAESTDHPSKEEGGQLSRATEYFGAEVHFKKGRQAIERKSKHPTSKN